MSSTNSANNVSKPDDNTFKSLLKNSDNTAISLSASGNDPNQVGGNVKNAVSESLKVRHFAKNLSFNIKDIAGNQAKLDNYFCSFDFDHFLMLAEDLRAYIAACKDDNLDFNYQPSNELLRWVQKQHPLSIYKALKATASQADDKSLALLYCISDYQFKRVIDLDVWQDDQISLARVVHWLVLYNRLSDQIMFDRFCALEEEYQIAIFQPYIKGFTPEQFETLPVKLQDELYSFPADAFFYQINIKNNVLHDFCHYFIELMQKKDMRFALSFIDHVTWLPGLEAQNYAVQFKKSRNEEDGFFSYFDANISLLKLDKKSYEDLIKLARFNTENKYSQAKAKNSTTTDNSLFSYGLLQNTDNTSNNVIYKPTPNYNPQTKDVSLKLEKDHYAADANRAFLLSVLDHVRDYKLWDQKLWSSLFTDLVFCSNHLIAAQNLEPWQVNDENYYFMQIISSYSLSLDLLSGGCVKSSIDIISKTAKKSLINFNRNWANDLQLSVANNLAELKLMPDNLSAAVKSEKLVYANYLIDSNLSERLNPIDTELLKGVFNPYPFMLNIDYHHDYKTQISSGSKNNNKTTNKNINSQFIQPANRSQFLALIVQTCCLMVFLRLSYDAADQQIFDGEHAFLRGVCNVLIGKKFVNKVFDLSSINLMLKISKQDRALKFAEFIKSLDDYIEKNNFYQLMCSLLIDNFCYYQKGLVRSLVYRSLVKRIYTYFDLLEDIILNTSENPDDILKLINKNQA